MASFLGVPIVSGGAIVGAFYLTDKEDAATFSDDDQALIATFAAHAALALENARLHERSRELSIVEERNRLARELHDAVTQKLFGVVLAAESGAALLERDLAEAGAQLALARDLAREAMEELRSVIVHLRPVALEAEGLAVALGKHVDVLRRAHRRDIVLDVDGSAAVPAAIEADVFRIAQEALHNALRHAQAARIEVRLRSERGRLHLTVSDDGVGFDRATVRARHLGLTTMAERALEAVAALAPDVVLMDLVMPGLGGVAAIERLRALGSPARVIVLTSFLDEDKVLPAVRAGAAGYLLKDVEPAELVRAIRTVDGGEALLHPAVAARVLRELAADDDRARRHELLTPREREVLALLARGRANKAIAFELGVAEKTVKTHVGNILGKLGLSDRTQAALYAVREGIAEG
jgi:DNA-binding NarL/FixJ family response regulator